MKIIFPHDEIIFFVRIFFCDQVCISTFDLAAQNNYMEALNRYMASKSKKVLNSLGFQSTIFVCWSCLICLSSPEIWWRLCLHTFHMKLCSVGLISNFLHVRGIDSYITGKILKTSFIKHMTMKIIFDFFSATYVRFVCSPIWRWRFASTRLFLFCSVQWWRT